MSKEKDDDWIATRVSRAKEAHSAVTEAVASQMKKLLEGQLSERQLPTTVLADIAKTLIANMNSKSAKG